MKTLYESILGSTKSGKDKILREKIDELLLSNNIKEQEFAIDVIKDLLKNEKRLKTCGKFENADTNVWYVKLPQYKGYSDDILFGHRVGGNHFVYRIAYDKTYHDKLFRMITVWKEVSANLSPRNNFVYLAPQELCDVIKRIESKLK